MFIKHRPNFKNSVYFKETEDQHSSLFNNIAGLNHHTPFLSFTGPETTNSIEVMNKTFAKYHMHT